MSNANRHSRPDAHSIRRNYPRYRQSVGIAGVVDAQERVARPDRRRLDECVDRTKRDALNLFSDGLNNKGRLKHNPIHPKENNNGEKLINRRIPV